MNIIIIESQDWSTSAIKSCLTKKGVPINNRMILKFNELEN